MAGMTIRSTAFKDYGEIPRDHSRAAGDVSPQLQWSGVPEDTAELALVCDDPDAPSGTFIHWLVAGIPPETTGLDVGADLKQYAVGRNDFGEQGYGGPHPPPGSRHRYFFRVYALSAQTRLADGFDFEELNRQLDANTLAAGTLVGTYAR